MSDDELGFGDPDDALDQIQAIQRAREAYGDPPAPQLAAAVLRHVRAGGLEANFVRVLDVGGNDDPVMIWILEIETGRGVIQLQRNPLLSWRDYLERDPECEPLNLLPPEVLRSQPCAVCGWAESCGDPPGEDCHS